MPILENYDFKNENDQHIWGECSRLLSNCIIYYNASILSNMLAYRETKALDSDVMKKYPQLHGNILTSMEDTSLIYNKSLLIWMQLFKN